MTAKPGAGSASIDQPDYWWYRARSELLRAVLEDYVQGARRVLDVGSADGPSVGWLRTHGEHVSLDIDRRGLGPGGVCGSALALPFADECFDVVAAFDVIEHCDPESDAMAELTRVLAPGGRLLFSVPAYQWAWTAFDDDNGHHRRYTRPRAVHAALAADLAVDRATYAFGSVFPMFAADRLLRRVRERVSRGDRDTGGEGIVQVPQVSAPVERLLMTLSRLDRRILASRRDLPFGSSIVVAASKRG